MKLKIVTVDGKTYAEVQDGKPVFVHDDGKEVAFDAPGTVATITRLNGEAKGHREAKEAAEGKLKAFEGIEDADAAKKALETFKNLDAGKLMEAGKVEELKAGIKKAAEESVAAANKANAEALAAEKTRGDKLEAALNGEMIGGRFARSKFVTDKTTLPGPAAQKVFGEHFKIEDGKVVAFDAAGNKLFSRAKPGEIAEFDEAMEILVDQYPYKDSILKGTGGGSGAKPGNGGGQGGKTISRTEFEGLPHADRAAKIKEGVKVID
ncbi:hypothetical protein GGQ99_001299 [Aminobacter niigataensis]|uniref:DUF6651 domain-containing protein n=1 Tax=Aminobacter niigataensis TaxID=83265 RepID=A0ABR6KYI1_9HYPH|nr:hypothetical protein [Aminobacter niigataensis]